MSMRGTRTSAPRSGRPSGRRPPEKTAPGRKTGGDAALGPLRKHGHEELATICLALPEADATTTIGQHMTFSVRGKTFVYYLDDHHGDGIVAVCCKTSMLEQADLVETEPERYYVPAYIGHHGWVGLRLDSGEVDWDEVEELVHTSYRLVAPKRLATLIAQ